MTKLGKHGRFRLLIQAVWAALTNGYIYGFVSGKIYKGKTKSFCVPGLSCYSCPGALGSCPIGALQATLNSPDHRFAFYAFGVLILFGSILGRVVCGWLCPFGLVQDLLHKIPVFKKRKNLPGHSVIKWIKYAVLLMFVIALPALLANSSGMGRPWFCEWICPSGTLFGGIPLVVMNEGLRTAIGFRFWWKIAVLLLIIVVSMKVHRPFCKYMCPLGAFYSLFNPVALYRYRVVDSKCTDCGACGSICKAGIDPRKTPNSLECIRCGECLKACPHGALELYNGLSALAAGSDKSKKTS